MVERASSTPRSGEGYQTNKSAAPDDIQPEHLKYGGFWLVIQWRIQDFLDGGHETEFVGVSSKE